MNKLLKSIVAVTVGLTMAIGAGVGAAASNGKATRLYAADPGTGGTDVLNASDLAASDTSYKDFSGVTKVSGAIYSGNSAKNNSAIQLRSKNSNSGIVCTSSGGKIASISLTWSSTTASRYVDIYGKNQAYVSASDLYNNSNQGTKLGSIDYGTGNPTSFTVTGDYTYIGIRSRSDALAITDLTIVWNAYVAPDTGSYTVTYNNNGGSGTMTDSDSPYESGSTVTVMDNTFTKSGYEFVNWNTEADGSGTEYDEGETFDISENVTLYAQWVYKKYSDNGDAITWDLTKESFDSMGTSSAVWSSPKASVSVVKSSSSTSTNNYCPPTRNTTRFYTNSEMTISPASGYKIRSIVFAAGSTDYANALKNSTWTNATTSVDSSTVTVTPTKRTVDVVVKFGATVGANQIVVNYAAVAPLSSISLSGTYPTIFTKGDAFSHSGMIVTANYTDGDELDVTSSSAWDGYNMSSAGIQEVMVSYTENAVTKTASYNITINEPKTIQVNNVVVSGISDSSVLDGGNDRTVCVNGTKQLTASVEYEQGEDYQDGNNSVAWTTSDDSIADIDSTGLVIFLDNGEVTITATSVEDGSKSSSISFTIQNINDEIGSENNPYTVAEARAAIDAGDGVTGVYVTGIISKIVTPFDSQYGNISYNISEDGEEASDQLEVFRGKSYGGVAFTKETASEIVKGKIVVVTGDLTKYNSTYEFAANNQLVSCTTPQLTPEEQVENLDTQSSLSYNYSKTESMEVTSDTLNYSFTRDTGTSYVEWSNKNGTSGVVYAGRTAGEHDSIQLNDSNSGVVSTSSNKVIKKITVNWNSNTAASRKLDIYGSNTPYSAASNLFGNSKGTLIGSIVCGESTELAISKTYRYVGVRSSKGAMYLDDISFEWREADIFTYSGVAIRFGGLMTKALWDKLSEETTIQGYGVLFSATDALNGAKLSADNAQHNLFVDSNTKANPSLANDNQKGDLTGDYYIWNLKVNVTTSDKYNVSYTAVAYIKTSDGYVLLKEVTTSVKDLADDYIKNRGYEEDAFDGSLNNLANFN